MITGFAGIAHREPNRDDYTQSSLDSRPRAERMLDLETSLRAGTDVWKFSVNLFYMGYRDQLVLDGRLNDVGAYIRTNVAESYRAGVELEAAHRVRRFFTVQGNAAFSRNKVNNFVEYRDNWDTGTQERIVYSNTDLAFSPNMTARLEMTGNLIRRRYSAAAADLLLDFFVRAREKIASEAAELIGVPVRRSWLQLLLCQLIFLARAPFVGWLRSPRKTF